MRARQKPVGPVLIAVLTLLTLLPACSGSGETVRLQVFGDGAEIAAYRALLAAFRRQHPDVKAELVPVPSQDDHAAKLAAGFATGKPPDLFLVNYRRFGQYAGGDAIEPLGPALGDRFDPSAFYPEALEAFQIEGRQVCLPQNVSSLAVYWNRTLFRNAGIAPPRPGWTWAEFLDAAHRVTADRDGNGVNEVFGVGTEPSLVRLAPFVWQAGGQVVDDLHRPTGIALDSASGLEALQFFIDLRRRHRVAPSQSDAISEDYEARFAGGRLGMLLESRRVTAELRQVKGLDWDVAPLPIGRQAASVLHSDAFCVARASKHKAAAVLLAEFALSAEGSTLLARSGRIVPSRRSVAESPAFLDPSAPPASARVFLDAIPLVRRVPNIAAWAEIEARADPIVEEWYYGLEPVPELIPEVATATAELFAGRRP